MSCIMRKPVYGFQLGLIQTGLYSHKRWVEAYWFGFRKKVIILSMQRKLCFFANAERRFSHDAAKILHECPCLFLLEFFLN